ncbi:hypothetical protein [Streptomyces sp. NL15-2K]|uniref:hypothetical protein n=1 Tax=Streptomyces sp. NL15-2K TaxID=376149 RepID=UPI000F58CC4F|nr:MULTISPECIES: hypothetical protein [Actinomycetes]WKX07303.1 hypothetical protein Q4V64_07325 [Kutzneria buriramensis]GCB51486.1 hypothetical protein SNL152K_8842 [Streptomyces sp. NL15-2K]
MAKLAITDYQLRTGFIGTPLLLPAADGAAVSEVGSESYSFGVDTVLGGLGEAKEATPLTQRGPEGPLRRNRSFYPLCPIALRWMGATFVNLLRIAR